MSENFFSGVSPYLLQHQAIEELMGEVVNPPEPTDTNGSLREKKKLPWVIGGLAGIAVATMLLGLRGLPVSAQEERPVAPGLQYIPMVLNNRVLTQEARVPEPVPIQRDVRTSRPKEELYICPNPNGPTFFCRILMPLIMGQLPEPLPTATPSGPPVMRWLEAEGSSLAILVPEGHKRYNFTNLRSPVCLRVESDSWLEWDENPDPNQSIWVNVPDVLLRGFWVDGYALTAEVDRMFNPEGWREPSRMKIHADCQVPD